MLWAAGFIRRWLMVSSCGESMHIVVEFDSADCINRFRGAGVTTCQGVFNYCGVNCMQIFLRAPGRIILFMGGRTARGFC